MWLRFGIPAAVLHASHIPPNASHGHKFITHNTNTNVWFYSQPWPDPWDDERLPPSSSLT